MLFQKIFFIEQKLLIQEKILADKRETLNLLKNILSKVDENYETIPLTDKNKLTALFEDLKDDNLSIEEQKMITLITD